ncbi:hypothetical protein DFH09DRAFT_1084960 [Mycena vulgaris]|nr:hypothetical protein DFH09DRAFT_1084960 [Mycena vulgaris]
MFSDVRYFRDGMSGIRFARSTLAGFLIPRPGSKHSSSNASLPKRSPLILRDIFFEHISQYPDGTHQTSGPLLPLPKNNRRRQNSPYARAQKRILASNARYFEIDNLYAAQPRQVHTAPAHVGGAGPSRIPMEDILVPVRDGKRDKYRRKLADGEGISEKPWAELVEKCDKCKLVFTVTTLKTHIKSCLGELINIVD